MTVDSPPSRQHRVAERGAWGRAIRAGACRERWRVESTPPGRRGAGDARRRPLPCVGPRTAARRRSSSRTAAEGSRAARARAEWLLFPVTLPPRGPAFGYRYRLDDDATPSPDPASRFQTRMARTAPPKFWTRRRFAGRTTTGRVPPSRGRCSTSSTSARSPSRAPGRRRHASCPS